MRHQSIEERRRRRFNPFKGPSQAWAVLLLASLPFLALLQGRWMERHQRDFQASFLTVPVERIVCDHCGGTGLLRDPAHPEITLACPVCYGVGGHYVRKLDKLDVLCPACAGMGRVIDLQTGTPRLCLRCGGRGLIRVE